MIDGWKQPTTHRVNAKSSKGPRSNDTIGGAFLFPISREGCGKPRWSAGVGGLRGREDRPSSQVRRKAIGFLGAVLPFEDGTLAADRFLLRLVGTTRDNTELKEEM